MRKIILQEFITLDGVMQAPGGPEEDEAGSFTYGGWTAPFFADIDESASGFMKSWMESTDILLGKRTYELFESYWPKHADIWPGIMDVKKYVASNTLDETAVINSVWSNSELIKSIEEIKNLKASEGGPIKVHGSGKLAQSLFKYDLVDELCLMTFPITLGMGKRLFEDGTIAAAFTLTDSLVTKNGVIFAYYKRDGKVQTGTVGDE